jgi:hypothetical protein
MIRPLEKKPGAKSTRTVTLRPFRTNAALSLSNQMT